MIRSARQEDDLSVLLNGAAPSQWNRDHLLVAEVNGEIVGMLALFDGGHAMLVVDHFIVSATAPSGTGALLIAELIRYAKAQGKVSLVFTTPSLELAMGAKKRGARVLGPMFRVTYPLSVFAEVPDA